MKNVFKRRINLKSFWDSAKAILVYRDYQYRLAIFTIQGLSIQISHLY
jgi:hypothetical protein